MTAWTLNHDVGGRAELTDLPRLRLPVHGENLLAKKVVVVGLHEGLEYAGVLEGLGLVE